MVFRLAADATLVLHLAFIAFAVFGGLLALRWPWLPLLQLPAAVWGVYVELAAGPCPLTELENRLRVLAGQVGYAGSFVERYLLPLIYPAGLTREGQFALAAVVLVFNVAVYALILRRRFRRRS